MDAAGSSERVNGFRVRGFNSDVDRLAVQSTHQTTFFLTRRRFAVPGLRGPLWHEVGIAKNELVVMRAYGAAPEIEIEPLGDRFGVLIVEATQQFTRTLRVGSRLRIAMKPDEAIVIKCEQWREPRSEGAFFNFGH